jgi:ABC-type Mn2+/Zn2+ transport system permease subunit
MLTFSLMAAGLGAVMAFAGFYCAYRFDLPLGPAEVALASLGLAMVTTTRGLSRVVERWGAT